MRLFVLFVILLSSLMVSSQIDFQEKSFVQKNILDRGYNDPIFLFDLKNTGYYWIPNRPQGRYSLPLLHRKDTPYLIAIHDVKEDESLLELEIRGERNTLQKTQDYIYNDENLNLKLNEFLEPIALTKTYRLQILHFVKDIYLENKNGIEYHQLKFQKNKDDKDVEDPILTSKHAVRHSKIANSTVVLGYHEHGRYDRNSLKDALLIRKKQTIYGVVNSKDDYVIADSVVNSEDDHVKEGARVYEKSFNPSEVESLECSEKVLQAMKDSKKSTAIENAYLNWEWAYESGCKELYQRSKKRRVLFSKMLREKTKTVNSENKEEIIKQHVGYLELINKNYSDNYSNVELKYDKAIIFYTNKTKSREEIYTMLDEAFNEDNDNLNFKSPKAIVVYYSLVAEMTENGKISEGEKLRKKASILEKIEKLKNPDLYFGQRQKDNALKVFSIVEKSINKIG